MGKIAFLDAWSQLYLDLSQLYCTSNRGRNTRDSSKGGIAKGVGREGEEGRKDKL